MSGASPLPDRGVSGRLPRGPGRGCRRVRRQDGRRRGSAGTRWGGFPSASGSRTGAAYGPGRHSAEGGPFRPRGQGQRPRWSGRRSSPGSGTARTRSGRRSARSCRRPGRAASGSAPYGGRSDDARPELFGGERAGGVDAVLVQGVGLAGVDAVQGFHRQRGAPAGHLAWRDGEDSAWLGEPAGGGSRDGDRGADPDADVDAEPGERTARGGIDTVTGLPGAVSPWASSRTARRRSDGPGALVICGG